MAALTPALLELAREVALEVRGPGSPRHALPPGRGRGSSVGSIVCYLTGLSHVDPVEADLSLGRFLNDEMAGVPDIDLDFPRDIREKLIVAVTERYGREHAALVASFSTYRSRGAIRDVGKALGLPYAELERIARVSEGWNAKRVAEEVDRIPRPRIGYFGAIEPWLIDQELIKRAARERPDWQWIFIGNKSRGVEVEASEIVGTIPLDAAVGVIERGSARRELRRRVLRGVGRLLARSGGRGRGGAGEALQCERA